jgi:ectoine hydroxylase-related dioxygenase (phytanoyl-CoA dioxygenase family)
MLTDGQKAHFETFGFLVLRQLFTEDEMAIIKRESDEIFDEARGGEPFPAEARQAQQPFFELRPFMSNLADDDRIYNIGVDLLGPDFVLDGTEGNLHVGDTAWHSGAHFLPNVKIAFYPEPATRDTGCLRVIPGSHRAGSPDLLAPLRPSNKDPDFRPFGMRPSEVPSYAFESQPGDLIVFTENVLHASFGGQAGRHQHAISFFANPRTEEEAALVRSMYERSRYSFRPSESYINSDRPRIRRMVSRLVEWGFDTIDH